VTSNYTYDAIYELSQVTQGANTTESYTYDPVGNRLTSLGVSPYSYNSSNELTSTPNVIYSYDANGNTTSKTDSTGTTTYAWDYENRLARVTLPGTGGTVTFKYDPFGRRIEKTTSSTTSVYVYDNGNLIEETNSSGTVVARYTQGLSIDEPLAMLRSTTTSFYEEDGLGSVTSLSNTAGALAQTYTFDSFGKQTASSGSLTNPSRYTAREFDTETNLYYNRARYLDPSTGRFLSEDPVRYLGGPNFYAYAQNNTPDLADPLGLSPVCTWIGTTKLASWTTATRRYTSPWTFGFATQAEGGPDEKSRVFWATIDCHWTRNYVRQDWETSLYLNRYRCVDNVCGHTLTWFEFSLDTKKKYLGEEPGGTEPFDARRPVLGWDNGELLDQVYCTKHGLVPPN
jgi:RHS repeat-associated protein